MSYEIEYDEIVDDIRCIVVLIGDKYRYGYCGVGKEHLLYGVSYTSLDTKISVHGGLTFSGRGEKTFFADDDRWYFGFDCIPIDDTPPPESVTRCGLKTFMKYYIDGIVCTKKYAVTECRRLAKQLSNMKGGRDEKEAKDMEPVKDTCKENKTGLQEASHRD